MVAASVQVQNHVRAEPTRAAQPKPKAPPPVAETRRPPEPQKQTAAQKPPQHNQNAGPNPAGEINITA
jgi:hypothetical protein